MLPALKEELCDFATKASKRDLRLEEFYIFHHISTLLVSWCRGHVLSPLPFHLYINKNRVHLKCHDPDQLLAVMRAFQLLRNTSQNSPNINVQLFSEQRRLHA